MAEQDKTRRFRAVALPHLDAAYNLARWLMNNDADAEDMVQEAVLRAFRYFESFKGGNGRAWLLSIVRHTCYDEIRRKGPTVAMSDLEKIDGDDILPVGTIDPPGSPSRLDPEAVLLRHRDREMLNRMIEALPADFRTMLVLRELEELSYREIAEIAGIPVGTVMSRLARARGLLQKAWRNRQLRDAADEL